MDLAATGDAAEIAGVAARTVPPVVRRLSYLPAAARDLLGLASILDAAFSVTDLELLTKRPAVDLVGPLREALAAGALVERGRSLSFVSEPVRQEFATRMPLAVRSALHRDLAWALAAAGRPPRQVAGHLLRGASRGDAEAVAWLRRAAEDAAAHAPDLALELLDGAIGLADPGGPACGQLAVDRAIVLMRAGRTGEGESACRDALAHGKDPERESVLRETLIRSLLVRGRAGDAAEEIDQALSLPVASDVERAHYQALASFAVLLQGDADAALALADRAIGLAGADTDTVAFSEALHAKASALGAKGMLAESADLAVLAMRSSRAGTVPWGPRTVTATAGMLRIATDRVAEGRAILRYGHRLNDRFGARGGQALHHMLLAEGLYVTGDWSEAASEVEASAMLAGDAPVLPVMGLGILALIAIYRDDLATARTHLAAARAALASGAAAMPAHRLLLARCLLMEASGSRGEALRVLRGGWRGLVAAGNGIALPEAGPELVRRLVAAGDTAAAADLSATVAAFAARNPGIPSIAGAALTCRGLAEGDPAALLAAVTARRAGTRPLALAAACEDAAALPAGTGAPADARTLLAEARELYERLGAVRCVARTAAGLRALGVRTGVRAPRTRVTSGWGALTATERRVASLVAERLSNPEIAERMFLSRRTVETHVSHAFVKLGLHSRSELAAVAAWHGTVAVAGDGANGARSSVRRPDVSGWVPDHDTKP